MGCMLWVRRLANVLTLLYTLLYYTLWCTWPCENSTSLFIRYLEWYPKIRAIIIWHCTVYPKKYAHVFCFAVLCCGYTWTDFPISIRLTSLALWQSNDCPNASKATLMNMDKYFMWINYERLHNHNNAKHNKTVCIFLGIYCNRCPDTPRRGTLLCPLLLTWFNFNPSMDK